MALWYRNRVKRELIFGWSGETYHIPPGRSPVMAKAGADPGEVAQQAFVMFGRVGLALEDDTDPTAFDHLNFPEPGPWNAETYK